MMNQTVATELAFLRDRVEYLEMEIARRDTDAESGVAEIMRVSGLSMGLARMLKALSNGQVMTRDRLSVLCCHEDSAAVRNVDSQIRRLRRRLPMLKIKNLYGFGYCLESSSIAKARQIMKEEIN